MRSVKNAEIEDISETISTLIARTVTACHFTNEDFGESVRKMFECEQGNNLVEAEIWILKDNGYTSPFPA